MKYIWYEVRNIIISNYYIEHALLYKSYERANVRRISYSRVPDSRSDLNRQSTPPPILQKEIKLSAILVYYNLTT